MSHPISIAALPSPSSARGPRLIAACGTLAVLMVAAGCLTRTVENEGLVAIPAETDTTAFGAMLVSPEARARGQRISRFVNSGTPEERAALRKAADRAMSAACAGSHRTGAEGPDAVDGLVTPRRDGSDTGPSPFWYVQFTCVRDKSTGTSSVRS